MGSGSNMLTTLDDSALEKLQAAYRERLSSAADALATFARQSVFPSGGDLQALEQLAHGMAGSGAIFGYAEVSAAGEALDLFLRQKKDDPVLLKQLIDDLRRACAESAPGEGSFDFARSGVDS